MARKYWLYNILKFSIFFTLPIVLVLAFLHFNAFLKFRNFTHPRWVEYSQVLTLEIHSFANKIHGWWRDNDLQKGGLKSLKFIVDDKNIKELNHDLPVSGKQYVEGIMLDENNESYNVKIRYRGDSYFHWDFEKKSLRVKTKKKKLYGHYRTFNLINPKYPSQMNTFLAFALSDLLGIITPSHEMVKVFLNGSYLGHYQLVEQIEELTLRNNNRMPGDIYSGEWVGFSTYDLVNLHVFDHPELWEKKAVNNHYEPGSMAPIEKLCETIVTKELDQATLSGLLNIKQFAKWSIFETLAQTVHYDPWHNWRLYYDPMKAGFEPIAWDPAGWGVVFYNAPLRAYSKPSIYKTLFPDIIANEISRALYLNYEFLYQRNKLFYEFFDKKDDVKFLEYADKKITESTKSILYDGNKVVDYAYLSNNKVLTEIASLKKYMSSIMDNAKKEFYDPFADFSYHIIPGSEELEIDLLVSGRTPTEVIAIDGVKLGGNPEAITATLVVYDSKMMPHDVDITSMMSVRDDEISLSIPLMADQKMERSGNPSLPAETIDQDPLMYELLTTHLTLSGGYYKIKIKGVKPSHNMLVSANRGKGFYIGTLRTQIQPTPHANQESLNHYVTEIATKTEYWTGEKYLSGVNIVRGDLNISPGTILKMAPGASLLVYGKLIAIGSDSAKIRIVAAQDDQEEPWGTFAIIGERAKGSVLKNAVIEKGSGLKADLYEFSGMFSVHDAQNVTVDNVVFRESKLVDDMVHVVYSSVAFNDCTFENALSDSLDIDISSVYITRSKFFNSGNDGLDLMTSKVVVENSIFHGSGDKGLSVGEKTQLFLNKSTIEDCEIGLQAKDGSLAIIESSLFSNNKQALHAYKKNWRYNSGGLIASYRNRFEGISKAIEADKNSNIHLFLSMIPMTMKLGKHAKIVNMQSPGPWANYNGKIYLDQHKNDIDVLVDETKFFTGN
jgi:hypothetical protein